MRAGFLNASRMTTSKARNRNGSDMAVPVQKTTGNKTQMAAAAAMHPLSIVMSVWSRRRLVLMTWLAVSAVTLLVVFSLPAVYSAEAVVLIESQRIPETYVTATVSANVQDRINALRQHILSYSRLAEIIDKYGLYRRERKKLSMEDLVEMAKKDVTITVERGLMPTKPGAFRVAFRGSDPEIVADVTNAIANMFAGENLRAREVEAEGTSVFLDAQLAEAKRRLEEQERQLSSYKLQHNGELPQQENALLSSVGQLRVQLTGIHDSLNRAQQTKSMLEASLQGAEATMATMVAASQPATAQTPAANRDPLNIALTSGATVDPPLSESERLQADLEALRRRYDDRHPDVQRLLANLAIAKEKERRSPAPVATTTGSQPRPETPPARPPVVREASVSPQMLQAIATIRERILSLRAQIPSTENEIKGLMRERESILREIAKSEGHLQSLPIHEQRLAAVTRDYEITSQNYRSLLDKKLAADVATDMERRQKSERFVIVDMARRPERPVKPKRAILNAGGCLFGLLLGVVAAAGAEFKRGAVKGRWEVPSEFVLLGTVPTIVARSPKVITPRAKRPWARLALVAAGVSIMVMIVAAGMYYGRLAF